MRNNTHSGELAAVVLEAAKLRAASQGHTKWPDEFKARVVALTRNVVTVSELSRRTGIYRNLIDRWRREEKPPVQPVFAEMAVVDRRRISAMNDSDAGHVLLRTPRGFVATLEVTAMIALIRSGAL